MRGAFNIAPPKPRYQDTWDPQIILTLLKRWTPAKTLCLKLLTFKVLLLILLVTGQRLQTVSLLDLDNMTVDKRKQQITFKVFELIKQSRPGYKNPLIVLNAFPEDVTLCVFTYLQMYITRTRPFRKDSRLFISFKKPFLVVTKNTLGRWVKCVMQLADIDTNVYKPHSVRSASTSAALRGGAPVEDILTAAGWTKDSIFAKFYNRPILKHKSLDVAVLSNKKS